MFDFAEGWANPKYLVKDADVIIPFMHEGKLTGLRCRVEVACGDCGLVVCEKHQVRKWVKLEDMGVRSDSPMARAWGIPFGELKEIPVNPENLTSQ